jgi:hypothetical protein
VGKRRRVLAHADQDDQEGDSLDDTEGVVANDDHRTRVRSAGEVVPETHPDRFDEDVVCLQVRILERHDFPWLLVQLQNTAFDRTCRELVLANLSQEAGNKVLTTW